MHTRLHTLAGLIARIEAELATIRPPGRPMPLHLSTEPLLDTWRGAAALAGGAGSVFGDPFAAAAAAGGGGGGVLTRAEYEEAGVDYLRDRFSGFAFPQLP